MVAVVFAGMVKTIAWIVIGVSVVALAAAHAGAEQQHAQEIGEILQAPIAPMVQVEVAPPEARTFVRPSYGHVHTAHCR